MRLELPVQPSRDQWFENWMARRKTAPAVAARILRLNKNLAEGERIRGWHPTRTARNSIHVDVCSRQTFEKRWGKGSARRLPPGALVKAGGRRRWISGIAYMQGPTIPN